MFAFGGVEVNDAITTSVCYPAYCANHKLSGPNTSVALTRALTTVVLCFTLWRGIAAGERARGSGSDVKYRVERGTYMCALYVSMIGKTGLKMSFVLRPLIAPMDVVTCAAEARRGGGGHCMIGRQRLGNQHSQREQHIGTRGVRDIDVTAV